MKSRLFRRVCMIFVIFNFIMVIQGNFFYITNLSERQNIILRSLNTSQSNPQIQWGSNGTEICSEFSWQVPAGLCSDDLGNTIIVWYDNRHSGNLGDIYAQKVNSNGISLWDINGTVICEENHGQGQIEMCCDGLGGAIIVWVDERDDLGDIYAQRVDSNGALLWDINGTIICNDNSYQSDPDLCRDGSGGAIITWTDERNGDQDIYAQRISAGGNTLWDYNGTAICNLAEYQGGPVICSDDAGGAIIAWADWRVPGYGSDIYAQRIAGNGSMYWTENGTGICTSIDNNQDWFVMSSDGFGGAIIAWQDFRDIVYTGTDIYVDRINKNGISQWNVDGKAICTILPDQYSPYLCVDNSGGAIIAWSDGRGGMVTDYDIYAQKLDPNGNIQWASNGKCVCNASYGQWISGVINDGKGGAIILWRDERNGDEDVYIQRLNSEGDALWYWSGLVICNADNEQDDAFLINDGKGGAIITWSDLRNDAGDIYAQRVIYTPTTVEENGIPLGDWYLLFIFITCFALIIINLQRKKKQQ
ncbi:MAG: hypothetical protein ACFE8J_15010, partial [Candidatus Heimdallarchaeota archaeon]